MRHRAHPFIKLWDMLMVQVASFDQSIIFFTLYIMKNVDHKFQKIKSLSFGCPKPKDIKEREKNNKSSYLRSFEKQT